MNKIYQLNDLPKFFKDSGNKIAIGGQSVFMNPMGAIKQFIGCGCPPFHLIASPVGGLGIDMLIGAGLALSVEFAQISLWEYGLAPNMRRYAENGLIKLKEHA